MLFGKVMLEQSGLEEVMDEEWQLDYEIESFIFNFVFGMLNEFSLSLFVFQCLYF